VPFFLGLKVPVGGRRKYVGQVSVRSANSCLTVDIAFGQGKSGQVFTVDVAGCHTTVAVAA
jgi:hypothetical protein